MGLKQTGAEITVKIDNAVATRLNDDANQSSAVNFNIKVNMNESERSTEQLVVRYSIVMNTEPVVAKFQVEGSAIVRGRPEDMDEVLSADAQTGAPYLFTKVYQQVYPVIFMLAGATDIPYPSPGLLQHSKPQAQVAEPVQQSVNV